MSGSGLYPHPSASVEGFKVGDQVRWYINEKSISPYVGVVTTLCPEINKVWVEFPIGGNQQRDPTELIIVTPFMGKSPVDRDTGYNDYGRIRQDIRDNSEDKKEALKGNSEVFRKCVNKAASFLSDEKVSSIRDKECISKMASRISNRYNKEIINKISSDIVNCVEAGLNDVQAYSRLYPEYNSKCSDKFIKSSIDNIYKLVNK